MWTGEWCTKSALFVKLCIFTEKCLPLQYRCSTDMAYQKCLIFVKPFFFFTSILLWLLWSTFMYSQMDHCPNNMYMLLVVMLRKLNYVHKFCSTLFFTFTLLSSSILLQTPECSEYHPFAQSSGQRSLLSSYNNIEQTTRFYPSLILCQFLQIFLENLSPFKNFFFIPPALRCLCVSWCVWGVCVSASMCLLLVYLNFWRPNIYMC